MPSFDVVSEIDWAELKNAVNQAQKELAQRYDFRGTDAAIDQQDQSFAVSSNAEDRTRAALDVFQQKLVRRKVSLKHFEADDPKPAGGSTVKIAVKVIEGIDRDKAKDITKLVKESKLKVQASIHDKSVRVTGKKRDDLQKVIQMLKDADLDIELQYKNFRD